METNLAYTYWRDGAYFVGFLDIYPDESTQGTSLDELEEALREVYEIRQEEKNRLSKIRRHGALSVAV
jgi:predicted RNase H-like HicB family nuclease